MKRAAITLCVLLSLAFQTPPAVQKPEAEPCYCAHESDRGLPYGDPNTSPPTCTGLKVAYKQKEVDKKAVLTARVPEPSYTDEARADKVTGVVRLRVVLCPSGQVSNVSVIKGLPDGLTERAILAVKGVKFKPAEKDGEKVAQFQLFEFNFNN